MLSPNSEGLSIPGIPMPEERLKNEKLDVDVGDYEIEVPGSIPDHKTTTQSHNTQSIYRQAKQDEGGEHVYCDK